MNAELIYMPVYEVSGKNSTKRIKVEVDVDEPLEDFDKRTTEEYIAALNFFELVDYIDSVKVKKENKMGEFSHTRGSVESKDISSEQGEVLRDST